MSRNQLFELVGLGTVVLSLLFVAYEIRQSNEIATTANVNEVYSRFSTISETMISDPILTSLLIKSEDANELSELTEEEQRRLVGWVTLNLDNWIASNIAYDNDQLSDVTYNSMFDDANFELQQSGPVRRRIWRDIVSSYPSISDLAIVEFIDSELQMYESQGLMADPE